jgi:phage gpG-like protein
VAEYLIQYQLGDVTELLTAVETRLGDASDLMADVLLLLIRSTQLNFDAQGRPDRWADLAPSTLARRRGDPDTAQILRDTGLLMQSLGAGSSGAFEAADGFGESDEFTATLGTNRPGADALQLGNPGGNLPAREHVLFQAQDYEDLDQMQEDFVMGLGPYAFA